MDWGRISLSEAAPVIPRNVHISKKLNLYSGEKVNYLEANVVTLKH